MVAHTCKSQQGRQEGGSEVKGHPPLHTVFKVSLRHTVDEVGEQIVNNILKYF